MACVISTHVHGLASYKLVKKIKKKWYAKPTPYPLRKKMRICGHILLYVSVFQLDQCGCHCRPVRALLLLTLSTSRFLPKPGLELPRVSVKFYVLDKYAMKHILCHFYA